TWRRTRREGTTSRPKSWPLVAERLRDLLEFLGCDLATSVPFPRDYHHEVGTLVHFSELAVRTPDKREHEPGDDHGGTEQQQRSEDDDHELRATQSEHRRLPSFAGRLPDV